MTALSDAFGQPVESLDDFLTAAAAIGCDPEEIPAGSGRWSLRCPHPDHADNTPAATLTAGTKGAPYVLHCFVCWPSKDRKPAWLREAIEAVSQGTMKPAAEDTGTQKRGKKRPGPSGRPVAAYAYTTADGTVAAQKVRYLGDDGSKAFGWKRPVGDAMADGLGRGHTVDMLPMYGLPSLTHPGPVYVVEGEKDADRLHTMNLAAVTAGCGASKNPDAIKLPRDMGPLTGRDVIVVADRDQPGGAYARAWADLLDRIATSVRLAQSLTTGTGDDVSDHLDAGHDLDSLDFGPVNNAVEPHRGRRVTLTSAATIAPQRAKWLWAGRMAVGTLTILAGREGVGKSTLAYWLAAQITRGTLPGEMHGTPAAVIVAATEDSWAHTIVPRLIAAGADLARVYRVDVTTDIGGVELSLPTDVTAVGEAAEDTGAALLLLDPLMSRLSASLDTHKDQETRQALEPLTKMLDATRLVAVGLMHFNKRGTDDPLDALMASRAFSAVARSVSTVVRDPDDEDGQRRLFGTPKNNLGPDNLPLLSFTLESHAVPTEEGDAWTSRIVWGDEVADSITEVLRRSHDGDRTATQEAADWLGDYLTNDGGQADSAAIKKAGRAAGHSEDSVKRARKRLRIVAESHGFPRRTIWRLPEAADSRSSPVGATTGETHPTALTAPTEASQSSRSSQCSQVTPGKAAPTGDLLGLITSCVVCGTNTVTNPCHDCATADNDPTTAPKETSA